MSVYKMLDGNAAAVEAMKMARVKVIAAYPITPQSSISEMLADLVEGGELDAKYIRVESEHSAMSCVLGAQATGVRAATATSSVGLALMHEILNSASGTRQLIVMPVVNRALASPWSLWCDHQDAMAERDSGWMQFYCENVQDVFDSILMAYRVAEHRDVLTPAMVCLDGFFLSHSMQKLVIPTQEEVDAFLGEFHLVNTFLDTETPMVMNTLTPSDEYGEMRYQQAMGMEKAKEVMDQVYLDFEKTFGRRHRAVEGHMLEDAETVIVAIGSMAGTAKFVVNKLREQGQKVGALKISSFRPFRNELVCEMLSGAKKVAVLDRSSGLGAAGAPLYLEVKEALEGSGIYIKDYIAGLGGRDISIATIEAVFDDITNDKTAGVNPLWIDLKDNAVEIRRVSDCV